MASWLSRSLPLLIAGMVVLFALKLIVLILVGPTMEPDSAGYIAYADAIMSGSFLRVDLSADAIPWTLARPVGYPAVIAAAKIVAGPRWAWVVVLFQFATSIWATASVYRLARMFRLGVWVSLGVAAVQASAMQFVLDNAILSDSLCASMLTVATCTLSEIILRSEPPNPLRLFGVGWLIVGAFLVRDVIAFLAVAFVPLAAAAAWNAQSQLRRLAAFALIFIPLIVAQRAYFEWNRLRVGAAIVTTIPQWTLPEALAKASVYDPTIFSGATEFDQVARHVFATSDPLAANEVSLILFRDYGWSAVRVAHEAWVAYLRAWMGHPMAMIRYTLTDFFDAQLHEAVRPAETVRDVVAQNTKTDADYARAFPTTKWLLVPGEIARRLAELFSAAIFASFILITPLRLFRESLAAETSAVVGIWSAYVVFGAILAPVQVNPRYLMPVAAGLIVIGAANIGWLVAAHRRRSAMKPKRETPVAESVA